MFTSQPFEELRAETQNSRLLLQNLSLGIIINNDYNSHCGFFQKAITELFEELQDLNSELVNYPQIY